MNRGAFTLLMVLILAVVAFGFYRGWFVLGTTTPEPGNNKIDYHLTVDPDKVKADAELLKDKATGPTGKVTDGSK